jgi:hypothetical protein
MRPLVVDWLVRWQQECPGQAMLAPKQDKNSLPKTKEKQPSRKLFYTLTKDILFNCLDNTFSTKSAAITISKKSDGILNRMRVKNNALVKALPKYIRINRTSEGTGLYTLSISSLRLRISNSGA